MPAPSTEPGGVRPASAAGLYYPKDADGLRCALRTLLDGDMRDALLQIRPTIDLREGTLPLLDEFIVPQP